jgi:hypothetical protein
LPKMPRPPLTVAPPGPLHSLADEIAHARATSGR